MKSYTLMRKADCPKFKSVVFAFLAGMLCSTSLDSALGMGKGETEISSIAQDNKIIDNRDVSFLTVQCQNDLDYPDCRCRGGQYCISGTGVIHHVMDCSSTDSSSEIEIDKKQYSSSEEESSSETDREIEEAKASQLNNDKKPRKNTEERNKPQKERTRQEAENEKEAADLNRIPDHIPTGYYPVYRDGQLGWYMPPMGPMWNSSRWQGY